MASVPNKSLKSAERSLSHIKSDELQKDTKLSLEEPVSQTYYINIISMH